ncbi:MAG: hypothetical protein LBL52_01095 [Rickettsiales bacterium]|nr:hypothetical protein [Rickettsiales bacterium]
MEEATKCIGTPEKSKWQLQFTMNGGSGSSLPQPLTKGVWRIDAKNRLPGSNHCGSDVPFYNSFVVVLSEAQENNNFCNNDSCIVYFKPGTVAGMESSFVDNGGPWCNGGALLTPGIDMSDLAGLNLHETRYYKLQ